MNKLDSLLARRPIVIAPSMQRAQKASLSKEADAWLEEFADYLRELTNSSDLQKISIPVVTRNGEVVGNLSYAR